MTDGNVKRNFIFTFSLKKLNKNLTDQAVKNGFQKAKN